MSTPGAASDSAGVQKKPDTDSELLDTALLLENLEANAKQMADSLAYISGGLRVNLHALSAISKQYIDAHQLAIEGIGDSVDLSLAAMSSLMMGCEQISENMPPVERLVQQLKGVKSTLSILEDSVNAPSPGQQVGTPQQYMPGSV